MSYSRRQLYAFGEPLGDGATRREVGGKTVYGSGGGGGTPEKQTTVVDIPDWAKPYAKESLGKAAALTSTPYQTYGGERIAQFTPMQKQAFGRAQGQEVASQIGAGSGLAGTAGLMGLTGGYQPGQFGSQMSQYMSPYMDAVVQQQMESAQRQADIAGTQRGAQAVRAGAFGGSRQAIENAEAARALASQKGQIQATGLQSAYDRATDMYGREQALAEQSRQAGLSTALGAAGQLGQLGQQQFGQQMDITGQQAQFGGQQRQATQDILSQQYQDFLNQQRAPYDQLSFMSSLIRGTPMGQTTTQYAPPPSTTSQLIGLGTAAAGAYGAYQGAQPRGAAAGGEVKSYASGGKLNLEGTFEVADGGGGLGGGGMPNNMQQGNQSPLGRNPSLAVLPQNMLFSAQPAVMPQGGNYAAGGIASLNQPEMAAMAGGMSDQQLQQTQGLPSITELARMTLAAEAQQRAQMRQQAMAQQAMMQQQPQATVAEEQMAALGGISDLPAPNLENLGDEYTAAGGGIVAFAPGGDVDLEKQREEDRARLKSMYEAGRISLEEFGRAIADIAALPLRGVAGAYDSAVVRPMRAAGLDAGYLSPYLVPEGVDPESMTPFSDQMRSRAPAAPATSGIAALADGSDNRFQRGPSMAGITDQAPKQGAGPAPAPTGPGRAPGAADTGIAAALPKSIQDLQAKYRGEIEAAGKAGETVEADRLAATKRDQEELGQPGAEREKRAKAQEKALEGAEGKNLNMALIEAGLAIMAGNSANAFENIGKGAMVGTKAYTTGMNRIQDRKEKLDESMIALDELRYSTTKVDKKDLRDAEAAYNKAKQQTATALAAVTGKEADVAVDMYTKQQDARSRENVARIAAGGAGGVGGDSKLITAAEAAFQRDPEAAAIRRRLENPIGTLNKTKEANDLARLRQIQADKYKQFGITMEQGAAASSAADPLGLR
jgi:hypothetical protein